MEIQREEIDPQYEEWRDRIWIQEDACFTSKLAWWDYYGASVLAEVSKPTPAAK
jgi:hypothetical protein